MTSARPSCKPAALWAGLLLACAALASNDAPDQAGSPLKAPDVRLAVPGRGFDDDAAYLQSIAGQVSELVKLAEKTDDPAANGRLPVARADLLLAAANLILAHQLEPACTYAMLGLDDRVDAARDQGGLAESLDRADDLLDRAEAVLQRGTGFQPVENRFHTGSDASRRRLGTLRAFARALRAYLLPDKSAEVKRDARRAASRLSALLEEDDRRVATAARLWQACLRGREADPTTALAMLELALSEPQGGFTSWPPEEVTYAFFARLLRCRLVAKQGGFATALALLSQLEERCEEWFPDESPAADWRLKRADAVRAITLTEIQVLRGWHGRLSAGQSAVADRQVAVADPAQAEEREWCVNRIGTLIEDRFPSDRNATSRSNTVLRLHAAIPIVAHPP